LVRQKYPIIQNIATYRPTARQRLDKNIPATNVHATIEGYPLVGNGVVNTVFSMGSVPRLCNESLSVVREIRLENWNWEFISLKRIVVEEPESFICKRIQKVVQ
jgi:hypothetical protein